MFMKRTAMNQACLSRATGIRRTCIYRWLHGSKASNSQIKKLAAAFKVNPRSIAPEYQDCGDGASVYEPNPCGMKRALEIIGKDYLDDHEHVACHVLESPYSRRDSTGRYVQ